jgi:hypothetical protein
MKQIFIVAVALSLVASVYGLATSDVFGQNSTSSNTTQTVGQQNATSANTTQAAAGPMAALTQSDFGDLIDNLNSAREALRDKDPAGAVGDLGSAETEVRTFMTQIGGENSTGGQQLATVLNHINTAQDASGNNDTVKAFQDINSADTELLKITQKLPADGDDDDD